MRPPSNEYDTTFLELRNNEGLTALHVAVQSGREESVSLLLEYGARVDTVSHRGYTILHDAVRYTMGIKIYSENQAVSSRLVRIILQHLVQHDVLYHAMIQDNQGNAAMHLAIHDCNYPTLRVFFGDEPWAPLLINAVINNRGETALHVAVHLDHVEMLSFFLQHKGDVSVRDTFRRTPLTLACELGRLNSIFILFMHGQGCGLRMF